MDLNIGFKGLALIQGQIYNPEKQLEQRGPLWLIYQYGIMIIQGPSGQEFI